MGLFGSLFGGKKKKTKTSSTQTINTATTQAPYSPVIPHLDTYLADTAALYTGGAPQISAMEQQGYDAVKAAAAAPSGISGAIAENNKTLSGQYLTPDTNPYLADIAKRVSGIAGSNANSAFAGRGRSGSGLAGYYAGKGVGDSLTDLYGSAYEAERGRMGSAVAAAPGLEAGKYVTPQALISSGQNISARPFDINSQYGGILAKIGSLGQQGTVNGTTTGESSTVQKSSGGLLSGVLGTIGGSFINKLFPV